MQGHNTGLRGLVVRFGKKERKQQPKGKKERKKTDNPREGWEDGTPPPHRDFKERSVMR